jgi:predicted PurR-regulated permease PerM
VIPDNETKKTVHISLNDSLRGVFSGSLKLAIYSALYTWMIFDWAQISYVYLYSLVAAFFKIVPLVSSSMIGLVAACQLYFSNKSHPLVVLCVLLAYLYVDSKLTEETYAREMRIANPFIMGISVFMGYYAFDLQGIFYGPLLICIVRIVYKALRALEKKNESGG